MYDFGPLHSKRFSILKQVKELPLQTGDILYRASDARGPLGLPFSRIVARLTNSIYSHAALVLMDQGRNTVVEVNDAGTTQLRFIDWLDSCYTPEFSIFRLKKVTGFAAIDFHGRLESAIRDKMRNTMVRGIDERVRMMGGIEDQVGKILEEDKDYDFTFSDPTKLYCTRSVAEVYEGIGVKLVEPSYIKDVLTWWQYAMFVPGNYFFKLFGTSLALDKPLYFVGNEKQGLMSSTKTECIFHYKS